MTALADAGYQPRELDAGQGRGDLHVLDHRQPGELLACVAR